MVALWIALIGGMGVGLAQESRVPGPGIAITSEVEHFEAKVVIDPSPGAKKFQGVWLERDDGQRWLIDYRARPYWTPFAEARVEVSGARYMPDGQAVTAVHFRLDTLRIVEPTPDHHLVRLGPKRQLTGRFVEVVGGPGTKSEARTMTLFAADGVRYFLANHEETFQGSGTATVRETALSPFVAHLMGPRLWVVSFEPGTENTKNEVSGE